jgi:ribosomal protein S8
MKTTFIYGLKVKGCDEIRYIGKSDNPFKRLKRHIYNTKLKLKKGLRLTHKDNWLIKNNFNIDLVVLEECEYSLWQQLEVEYINKFDNLTNTSSGGLGGAGIIYKLTYDQTKFWVIKNVKVKSKNDWYKYIKINELPEFIPSNPREVYKNRGWISWGDFLGTNKTWDNHVDYLSYGEAKEILKNMKISSSKKYKILFESGKLVKRIPKRPDRFYKNRGWISWGDFLGNGVVANQLREFYTYIEFKEKMKELNLKSFTSFKKYIKNNKEDNKIPTNPNVVYENNGWVSWYDVFN